MTKKKTYTLKINIDRCKGCALCMNMCAMGCIELDEALNKKGIQACVFHDEDKKCTGCLSCVRVCPECCIEVYAD